MIYWKKLLKEKEWRTEKWAFVALLTGFMLTSSAHFFSQKFISDAAASNLLLNQHHHIISKLKAAENHLLAMESNIQYFIFTDDRGFLREFDRNMVKAQRRIDEIEEMLPVRPAQHNKHFFALKENVEEKIEFNNNLLDVFRGSGKESAEQFINAEKRIGLNGDLWKLMETFLQAEGIDPNVQLQDNQAHRDRTILIDNIAYLFGIGLLVLALIYLLYSLHKRMKLQEHLIQAKEKVEKSAKIKEQFLANMRHEIRTPLQAILGFTNLLGKEKLTEKQTQFVHHVQIASESLLTIVNDILDVSKIESGMVRLEYVPFSLSGLMHSVDSLFYPKAREKDIYLKLHPNPKIPDLLIGDPTRLTQILVNLIGNAIKFTQEGGVDIFQEIVEQTPTRLMLKISVKDTGAGIPTEKLPTIFERFEQVDSKVTRMYGGSGLGLFIVKELVELQKGNIHVESKPGKGSVFSFAIPYAIADEKTASRHTDSGLIDLNKNFGDTKILLVEDNLMNQRVVGTFLSEWGMDYDIADNGKTAIQQLEKNNYDLVLMDIQMPEMDGYSATEYIRENMGLRIPIIAMTAHAFAGEREKALSRGMNDYISKPVKEEGLFQLIARFVPLKRTDKNKMLHHEKKEIVASNVATDGLNIDYNFLMETSKGKKEYLRSILELFLQQAPQEMGSINQAMLEGNVEAVGQLAHSMKSTVGYVGMDQSFRPLLESIERQAKNNHSPQAVKALIVQLDRLIEEAIDKVKSEAMPLVEKKEG